MVDLSGSVLRMITKSPLNSLARTVQDTSFTDVDEDVSTVDMKKFLKKECSTFVPASEEDQQCCGCGRLKTDHEQYIVSTTDEVWSSDRHTSQMPTDCFGSLSFSDDEQNLNISSQYVRLSDKTSPEMVWSLLTEIWNVKPPTLVLSLLGGNISDTLSADINHSLEEGLPKLIKAMKMWILTNGTDTGGTNIVSSSLLLPKYFKKRIEQKIACIGITSWGCTGWKEQLLGTPSTVVYRPQNEGETVKRNLCANHTHFLLVDDGSINRDGAELNFRASLDLFLSFNGIPLVNLLIGGGFSACMHLKKNFKANKRLHIVVIKGSGGLASVLEASLKLLEKMDCSSARLQDGIRHNVEEHMKSTKDGKDVNAVVNAVKEILELHKTQIFIFDPCGLSYGIHHAILEAARASSKGSEQLDLLNRLQLAIDMDEFEIAGHDLQHGLADAELVTSTLYKALKSGKSNFVQFFLKNGVNLKSFIGKDKIMLKKLYCKTIKNGSLICKLMSFTRRRMSSTPERCDLMVIDQLLDYFMDEDYHSRTEEPHSMTPCQELIVWAIFNDLSDMVECFWMHETRRSLENALMVFRLYRSMSKKLKNLDEMKRHALRSQANKYEQRAVELLTLCYADTPESATELIAARIPLWGNHRLISLAANGRSRNFVSHNCCQAYLKEIWHGMRRVNERQKRYVSWRRANDEMRLLDETDRCDEAGNCTSLIKNICAFFKFLFFVPKGKAILHMVMYLIFLGCFMYKLLIKDEDAYSPLWFYINVFVAAELLEKICEVLSMQKRTMLVKTKEWWHSMWKKIDLLSILLFYISIGMAAKFDNGSRAVRAAALVLWIIKFSQFYRMIHSLGPYLTMVYRMLLHMSTFIWVLLTVVVAFGIFLHSFLYSAEKLSWMIIFRLLFRPYLLVFGELGISTYSIGKAQTVFGTTKLDTARELIAVFGMCVYILIANVLLLNVLIAVFNNIYEDIKENSDKIWKFDRYHVIMEYSNKPFLPPPLSIISTLIRLICLICSRNPCLSCSVRSEKDVSMEKERLQHGSMREFLRADEKKLPYFVEDTLQSMKEKVEGNQKAMLDLSKRVDQRFSEIEALLKDYHHQIVDGITTHSKL